MESAMPQTRSPTVSDRGFLGLSRAPLYWELHLNRSLYVLGFLAMVLPLAYALVVTVPTARMLMAHLPGLPEHYLVQGGAVLGLGGWPGNSDFPVVVAGGLGFAVMAVERMTHRVVYLLEGPVRRRELLRVKIAMVALTILLAGVLSALMVMATSLRLGGVQLAASVLHVLLATAMAEGLAMTTLSAATIIANPITAGAATLIAMFLVPFCAAVGYSLGSPLNPLPGWLGSVSIFPTAGFPVGGPALIIYAAADCAWAIAMGLAALGLWDRVPVEDVEKPFAFPVLWNLYGGGLAALSAVSLIMLLNTGNAHISAAAGLVLFFPLGAGLWFCWRWVISYVQRYRELRS